jgi:hypothetical protein
MKILGIAGPEREGDGRHSIARGSREGNKKGSDAVKNGLGQFHVLGSESKWGRISFWAAVERLSKRPAALNLRLARVPFRIAPALLVDVVGSTPSGPT